MQRRALRRWFAVAGAALAGCFYTEPINRQPKVLPPLRVCDVYPADPCSPDNVHHGDHIMVRAVFSDPDGDVNDGTVQWRISACDGTTTGCDSNRLYDQTVPVLPPYPEFIVPPAMTGSGVPVRNIVFELVVFDDRGASSTAEDSWNVIPDPSAQRSAGTGAP